MKKWVSTILASAVVLGTVVPTLTHATTYMDVIVNGKKVTFPDARPFIDQNWRTMVPVRFVAENLGAKVNWNQSTHTADLILNGTDIRLTVGEKRSLVNNVEHALDTQVISSGGRTFVPLRFVSESLGATVNVVGNAVIINLNNPNAQAKYDPYGRLIRTTNLPKNYQDYPYILADLPNDFYERPWYFYDASRIKTAKTAYAVYPEFTKDNVDLWMSRVRNDYDLLLNVDYRTINYKWATDVESYRISDRDLGDLKQYVDWVKKNHIKIEGYVDPEPSTMCLMHDYTVRARYKIKIDSYDTWQDLVYDETFVNLPHLDKGVWYEGYTDIELGTDHFGDFGPFLMVSNRSFLWDSWEQQQYFTIKRSN